MALPARNVLSLCAGVGGLELGIALALASRGEAARGICYVEREASAAASLVASMEAGWFHPAPVWSDLATFDGKRWRGCVDILASGDPCQENSVAGKRNGAKGARFLAPEVVRIAAQCGADLIFRENVPGNADGQLEALCPPLEMLGYRVAAGIFSSSETGNTMQRERLFIMAVRQGCEWRMGARPERECLPDSGRCGGELGRAIGIGCPSRRDDNRGDDRHVADATGQWAELAGASCAGLQGREFGGPSGGEHRLASLGSTPQLRRALLPPAVIPGPTDSRWIHVIDRWPELQPALSAEEAESHLRRGIDAMAHRTERLRATGNGVDPVAAAYAFLSLDALLSARAVTTQSVW